MGRITRRHVLAAVGLLVGVLWALPVDDVRARCPPAGEGYGWCAFQKAWAPAAFLVFVPPVALLALGTFCLDVVPFVVRQWRRGLRPVHTTSRQAAPPYESDPFLLGATWGERTGRGADEPRVQPTDFVGRGRARRGA